MKILFEGTGTVKKFAESLHKVIDPDIECLLIFAGDGNGFTPNELDPLLKSISIPIFGGIFPQIIYQHYHSEQGTLMIGLPNQPQEVVIIPNLSDAHVDFEETVDQQISEHIDPSTIMVFVDAMSSRIAALIEGMFNVFGLTCNYIGGGAGSLSFEKRPCLFTNQGLLSDSALIVLMDMESGMGVKHGWEKVSGPFRVTQSDKNIIQTLDGKPALDVYQEIVEKHSRSVFTDDNFFKIARNYPFGINKLGTEKVVRDPLMKGCNRSIVCVGEVPAEFFVDILTGNNYSLVRAAKQALAMAKAEYSSEDSPSLTLFMDCISRAMFLGEKLSLEIDAVLEKEHPLVGAFTIGEIANCRKDYLEFYNKTAVVGLLK
ncbi:MAG: FIST C-terminal domain-containing protein [SAR324 cluster bacterium]|nr:FIST C-terminal domain-containing protein [SAR324 cluster bacterium]